MLASENRADTCGKRCFRKLQNMSNNNTDMALPEFNVRPINVDIYFTPNKAERK